MRGYVFNKRVSLQGTSPFYIEIACYPEDYLSSIAYPSYSRNFEDIGQNE